MHKKLLTLVSLLVVLSLSGCFSVSQEIWHNQDGSGRVVLEIILEEAMLSLMGVEDNHEDILSELAISPEDISGEDPNVRNVVANSYYDPDTASFHVIMDIEVFDLVKGLPVDDDADLSGFEFTITDNNDGSFRFSQINDSSADMDSGALDEATMMMFNQFMVNNTYTLKLHVAELIEADPRAVYDRGKKVVVWEMPMLELMSATAPIEFWAVYRTESSSVLPTLDVGGGLPNWVPFVLLGLCCLSLVAVIVIVIVIVLIARKRKPDVV